MVTSGNDHQKKMRNSDEYYLNLLPTELRDLFSEEPIKAKNEKTYDAILSIRELYLELRRLNNIEEQFLSLQAKLKESFGIDVEYDAQSNKIINKNDLLIHFKDISEMIIHYAEHPDAYTDKKREKLKELVKKDTKLKEFAAFFSDFAVHRKISTAQIMAIVESRLKLGDASQYAGEDNAIDATIEPGLKKALESIRKNLAKKIITPQNWLNKIAVFLGWSLPNNLKVEDFKLIKDFLGIKSKKIFSLQITDHAAASLKWESTDLSGRAVPYNSFGNNLQAKKLYPLPLLFCSHILKLPSIQGYSMLLKMNSLESSLIEPEARSNSALYENPKSFQMVLAQDKKAFLYIFQLVWQICKIKPLASLVVAPTILLALAFKYLGSFLSWPFHSAMKSFKEKTLAHKQEDGILIQSIRAMNFVFCIVIFPIAQIFALLGNSLSYSAQIMDSLYVLISTPMAFLINAGAALFGYPPLMDKPDTIYAIKTLAFNLINLLPAVVLLGLYFIPNINLLAPILSAASSLMKLAVIAIASSLAQGASAVFSHILQWTEGEGKKYLPSNWSNPMPTKQLQNVQPDHQSVEVASVSRQSVNSTTSSENIDNNTAWVSATAAVCAAATSAFLISKDTEPTLTLLTAGAVGTLGAGAALLVNTLREEKPILDNKKNDSILSANNDMTAQQEVNPSLPASISTTNLDRAESTPIASTTDIVKTLSPMIEQPGDNLEQAVTDAFNASTIRSSIPENVPDASGIILALKTDEKALSDAANNTSLNNEEPNIIGRLKMNID